MAMGIFDGTHCVCNSLLTWMGVTSVPFVARVLGAVATSWVTVWWGVPRFTAWVQRLGTQPIRLDGPAHHVNTKQGKATMGGVLLVANVAMSAILWSSWTARVVWLTLAVCVGFALIGVIDDWHKIRQHNTKGLSPRAKMMSMSAVAVSAVVVFQWLIPGHIAWTIPLPWNREVLWPVAAGVYALWSWMVIVGSANAVNLTDGLDGLAILSIIGCCVVLGCGAYLSGTGTSAIVAIDGAQELVILCASVIGGGLAFLWYNAMPSSIMMGDVGALALGGLMGTMATFIKQEWFFGLSAGLFIVETLSVVAQVFWFRHTGGRRLFRMAPIHHHFEAKGWSETQVVLRFFTITALLCMAALGWLTWR